MHLPRVFFTSTHYETFVGIIMIAGSGAVWKFEFFANSSNEPMWVIDTPAGTLTVAIFPHRLLEQG